MYQVLKQQGFTLIEIAIVLVIVTVLLGYTVAMFPIQQELKQYRNTEAEMEEIIDHLIAFAQVNGRLPCPDTDTDGLENSTATGCAGNVYYEFLPGRTLGIDGSYDASAHLIDAWGQPYRYAVSESDFGADGEIDFVVANEIRAVGISNALPDLFVCDNSTVLGNHINCGAVTGGAPVLNNVAAVVISTGKDQGNIASNIQVENTDNFGDGSIDKVYIMTTRSDTSNSEFDDIVKWISPNLLFSKMIEADQLP